MLGCFGSITLVFDTVGLLCRELATQASTIQVSVISVLNMLTGEISSDLWCHCYQCDEGLKFPVHLLLTQPSGGFPAVEPRAGFALQRVGLCLLVHMATLTFLGGLCLESVSMNSFAGVELILPQGSAGTSRESLCRSLTEAFALVQGTGRCIDS